MTIATAVYHPLRRRRSGWGWNSIHQHPDHFADIPKSDAVISQKRVMLHTRHNRSPQQHCHIHCFVIICTNGGSRSLSSSNTRRYVLL